MVRLLILLAVWWRPDGLLCGARTGNVLLVNGRSEEVFAAPPQVVERHATGWPLWHLLFMFFVAVFIREPAPMLVLVGFVEETQRNRCGFSIGKRRSGLVLEMCTSTWIKALRNLAFIWKRCPTGLSLRCQH